MFILPSALMFTCYLYVYRIITTVQNLPDDLEQYALTNCKYDLSTIRVVSPHTRYFLHTPAYFLVREVVMNVYPGC